LSAPRRVYKNTCDNTLIGTDEGEGPEEGKRRQQGQGDGDQQGQRSVDCVSRNLVPRSIGGAAKQLRQAWVRGTHFLFTVPPLHRLRECFYFYLEYPPTSPCPPSVPKMRSISKRYLQCPRIVLRPLQVPPSAHRRRILTGWSSTQTARATYHNLHDSSTTIFSAPPPSQAKSPPTPKERTLPQLPSSLLPCLPYFRDGIDLGNKFVRSALLARLIFFDLETCI
jgi:hypothetical protein